MMRYLIIVLLMMATNAYADSSSLNLALPSMPGNYQSDKFRTGDLDCSNAIGSATKMEMGVTGIISRENQSPFAQDPTSFGDSPRDIGVYARITIPLGKRVKNRINCNELYQLELRKKRLEVMKLERELLQMQTLEFEN
tara:strand:+ start:112 stop:528 length:417 start_codon:yes stop_codon:yes gene_type:complete